MRENGILDQANQLILYVSRAIPFRSGLDRDLIRLPVFGVRGAGYFLATTETIFGTLIFLGYWSPKLGILGALGSIVTFIGTTTIIPFLPDAWAQEAGGFPIMTLPLGFLMKDVLFLAASFYLLKQDLVRAAMDIERS
jgi:uncharacterized membrane protein YkgB